MKRFKYSILTLALVIGIGFVALPTMVSAADLLQDACAPPNDTTALCKDRSNDQLPTIAKNITNTLLYVLGAVSVIVIIVAGIMYTTSSGDAALITKAKNTLLYAIVGLVVAIMAYAIVNFVVTQFK